MLNKKNITINFSLLYFIHYLTSALIMGQRMTFLIRTSYTIQQRSLMFAAIPLVSIALQFFIGYVSDKYKTIKKIYVAVLVISAISAYLFYSVQVQMFVFHLAITILSNSVIGSLMDLSDVWVLESDGPSKDNYSFIRAFGSAGWSLGSFLVAQIVIMFGYQGLANASLLANILVLGVVATIRDDKSESLIEGKIDAIKLDDVKAIFKNRAYLLAIGLMFSLNFAGSTANYMLVDKMLLLGGDEWHVGMRLMIQAGIEIPILLIGGKIYKKLGSLKMIFIASIAYSIQFMGYYLATSNSTIFMVTAIQGISLPFFVVSIKYLLLELSPAHLKTTGQMVGPAIINGIQGVLHPLISAFLVGMFSIDAPFLFAFGFTLIAILLCIPLLKEYTKFRNKNDLLIIES